MKYNKWNVTSNNSGQITTTGQVTLASTTTSTTTSTNTKLINTSTIAWGDSNWYTDTELRTYVDNNQYYYEPNLGYWEDSNWYTDTELRTYVDNNQYYYEPNLGYWEDDMQTRQRILDFIDESIK